MKLGNAIVLGSLIGSLFLGIARAADPAPDGSAASSGSKPAKVQRRVAELEARLAKLQRELKQLRTSKGQPAVKPEVPEMQVFALQHAAATAMADSLSALIGGERAKELRIVADSRTNSVIVQATTKRMEALSKLIRLADAVAGGVEVTDASR